MGFLGQPRGPRWLSLHKDGGNSPWPPWASRLPSNPARQGHIQLEELRLREAHGPPGLRAGGRVGP